MLLPDAMAGARRVYALLLLCCLLARPAFAVNATDRLERAADAYKSSNYEFVLKVLGPLDDVESFPEKLDLIRGLRLMGLSYFFLKQLPSSHEAFYRLLRQDPDYQLDPFLDTDAAVKFFENVRQQENANLAPIRKFHEQQAEKEAQRKADELRRKSLTVEGARAIIERRVVQNSGLVAWMPFGLGQLQNGNTKLGIAFGIGEGITAISSIACYFAVEAMRETDNTFNPANAPFARRFNGAKWISAGLFYALWVAGAIEANVNFVPERVVGEAALAPGTFSPGRPDRPVAAPPPIAPPERPTPVPVPIEAPPSRPSAGTPPRQTPQPNKVPRSENEAPGSAPSNTVVDASTTSHGP
jgi:hypothetical protein